MAKILVSTALMLLISILASARKPWQCDDGSYCPTYETCCRGQTGNHCWSYENGTCCSNGMVCPEDSVCNVQAHKCDPTWPGGKADLAKRVDQNCTEDQDYVSPIYGESVVVGDSDREESEQYLAGHVLSQNSNQGNEEVGQAAHKELE